MKCPNCHHTAETALLKCSACGEVYDRQQLEQFHHLEYLLKWLDEQAKAPDQKADGHEPLQHEALKQYDAARLALHLSAPESASATKPPARAPAMQPIPTSKSAPVATTPPSVPALRSAIVEKQDGTPITAPVSAAAALSPGQLASLVKALALIEAARESVPEWVDAKLISNGSASKMLQHFGERRAELTGQLAGQSAAIEPLPKLSMIEFSLRSVESWHKQGLITQSEAVRLHEQLSKSKSSLAGSAVAAPAIAVELPPAPVAPRPAPVAKPALPPKPARPLIDWGKVWERTWGLVVSGALLRGLLYLGAFMIVVSAVVLVVAYWERFSWPVQLGFTASVPLAFYAGGFLLRSRLKIPVAGGVFTGIGAMLVAVDFVAVYRIGGLSAVIGMQPYWLIAAIVCTAIYIFTAWRVRGEFFAYLTYIGFTNIVIALTSIANLPLEWRVASATLSGAAMIGQSVWFRRLPSDSWGEMAIAARRLAYLLIPISLFLVLLVPGPAAFGQMSAFLFSAAGYGLLAVFSPSILFVHAALWCSVFAVGFGLRGMQLPPEWYAASAAGLAPSYLTVARWLKSRSDQAAPFSQYPGVFYLTGLGLVLVAIATASLTLIVDIWAGITALALASLVLAWCAFLFRRPAFSFVAAGLFVAPFSLAIGRLLFVNAAPQLSAWLMTALIGLTLVYLALGVVLQRAAQYGAGLNLWAQALVPVSLVGLLFNFGFTASSWFNGPTLVALGGAIAFYVASVLIHDGNRHPALSRLVAWLPAGLGQSIFLWPVAILIPVMAAVAWWGTVFPQAWFGPILAGLALAYVGGGYLLSKRQTAYALPFHVLAYVLVLTAIALSFGANLPLMTTLYIVVLVLVALWAVYQSVLELTLASALFLWPFYLSLQLLNVTPHAISLAYALLAAAGYLPLGLRLDRIKRTFALPAYVIGYSVSAFALLASLGGRFNLFPQNVQWVGVAVPLIVTGMQIFSLYRFRQTVFAWAACIVFTLTFGQTLTLVQLPTAYAAAAWVTLGAAYLLLERSLQVRVPVGSVFDNVRDRSQAFCWPLGLGAFALTALGLFLTVLPTVQAFFGQGLQDYFPPLFGQGLGIAFFVLAARLYHSRWPLFVEPVLAFVTVPLFFTGYSAPLFGRPLAIFEYGLVWSLLGIVHAVAAVRLDKTSERYSHGLYLGGYGLVAYAVLWTVASREMLLWTLGLAILTAIGSAVLVHFKRHHSWEQLVAIIASPNVPIVGTTVRCVFQWLAAWAFPIWCTLLLIQLNVQPGFEWLGFGGSSLVLLGLAVWLRRIDRAYGWPLVTAAQAYTAFGLVISLPATVRFLTGAYGDMGLSPVPPIIGLQTVALVFYAASAWVHRTRFYAYVATWLSFFPYTLSWFRFGPALSSTQFALPWIGLAAGLLLVGFVIDRNRVRYAHGPYLAGYCVTALALVWSVADRLINLYTLGAVIVIALASHTIAHYGRHLSFNDFIGFIWRKENTVPRRAAQTGFLFIAAYGFPVWLAQFMAYNTVPMAWRGLGLALAAPIYIALGLAARRVRSEYTWPLYSAGYALTAIGAMVSFENEALAIYVLALNVVVYAASSYIFRQSFWLYLSNSLLPVILLLTLHHNNALTAPWVALTLMGLAFAYFAIGQWFQRRTVSVGAGSVAVTGVKPFALSFLAPAYILSAAAMAVASGDKWLAIETYSAGVVLYALSAWAFRESVFLYPAVWLIAVPYYLLLTTTAVPPEWYGVSWLPLILAYIALGKFVFHKQPLGSFRTSIRAAWEASEVDAPPSVARLAFTHPALPFYLLAYALSVGMIVLSQALPLTFTVALAAGSALYFGSALLFRRAGWLYPALFAAHLGLVTYFAISPTGAPPQYLSLPFLGLTWLIALVGYGLSRWAPVTRTDDSGLLHFKLGSRELNFGRLPSGGFLITPSWSQPFFLFTAVDIFFWQWVALSRYDTAITVAAGFMLLLMLFASLWRDSALAYGSLAFLLLGTLYLLDWQQLPLADRFAVVGGLGFGLYLIARLFETASTWLRQRGAESEPALAAVWIRPLTHTAIAFAALAVVATLPTTITRTIATAASLAFAGALFLTIAFRGRYYRLGYAAMAMLQTAWALLLAFGDLTEPQLYAIPAGVYFIGMGYLERRRTRRLFAIIIETFGLAVLLLSSFIQSLNGGAQGLPYFVLLLVEGLLVITWGASRRLKVPFFIGLLVSALNVAGQIVVLFGGGSTLTRWAIIGSAGLLLVVAAVFVERQRVRLIAKTQEWREALELWE